MKKFLPFVFVVYFLGLTPNLTYGRVECVEGDCENGPGTMIYHKSSRYVGQWKDGKYHGKGTYTSPDGSIYEGEWKDGSEHGQGIYTSPGRYKYVGQFKEDEISKSYPVNWELNSLSDLGVSSISYVFNTGLIVAGLMTIIFSIHFYQKNNRSLTKIIIGILFLVTGIVSIGIGVFPSDYGLYHDFFAVGFFCRFFKSLAFLLMVSLLLLFSPAFTVFLLILCNNFHISF